MLLMTETAVRTAEKGWTHYMQVKRTESPNRKEQWAVVQHPNPTQLTLKRPFLYTKMQIVGGSPYLVNLIINVTTSRDPL